MKLYLIAQDADSDKFIYTEFVYADDLDEIYNEAFGYFDYFSIWMSKEPSIDEKDIIFSLSLIDYELAKKILRYFNYGRKAIESIEEEENG